MRKSIKMKVGAVGATFALAGSLAVVASGTTGAYFSDTQTGAITGTLGSIKVTTTGGTGDDGLNFAFNNLMPGVAKAATVSFVNDGTELQDVYLVFPNATALSALNDLGTFGEVHISVNGVEKFASLNLTDHYPSGTAGIGGAPTLISLPRTMLLASDVSVGSPNSFKFTFNYAGKLGNAAPNASTPRPASNGGGTFNSYPVAGQTTTKATDGTGSGLPFQVVAVQVGQQP